MHGGRVALISSGLSHVQRGFESFIADLAHALDAVQDIHLVRGSGRARDGHAVTLPTLKRNSWPLRWLNGHGNRAYRVEQISFVLSGWLLRQWTNFDLIYYCDTDVGDILYQLRKRFGYTFKLLYANCGPTTPGYREVRCEHVQQFSRQLFEDAVHAGVPPAKMTLLPMGITMSEFATTIPARAVRARYDIPCDRFVVLAASSLDAPFKRVRWLVQAIGALNDPSVHLWLVGHNQQSQYAQDTLQLAEKCLPGRYHHVTVPHSEMKHIFAAADVFVHPALQEGFGKVYLEAAAAHIPMLCHDTPHTRWLVGHALSRIDMNDEAVLVDRLRELKADAPLRAGIAHRNYEHVAAHFEWRNLSGKYLQMFEGVISAPRYMP